MAATLVLLVPVSAGAIGGLTGSYYSYDGGYLEDLTFTDPGYHHVFDRLDADVTFGVSEEHYPGNNADGLGFDWEPLGQGAGAFGVHWSGLLTIPSHRSLFLGTQSDDGSYVYIDDQLFVDNGGQHSPQTQWSQASLASGTYRIDTYLFCNERTPPVDKSGIDLWWSTFPHIVNAAGWVPSDWLSPVTGVAVLDESPTTPPVPEPATLTLLLTGLGSLGIGMGARRRRRY